MSDGKRRLRWSVPEAPPSKHPIRDTLLVYAGLAVIVVVIAAFTGGPVLKAVIVAMIFFVLASLWNIWRFRAQLRGNAAGRGSGPGRVGR